MSKVQELIEEYNLTPNSYYTESPYTKEWLDKTKVILPSIIYNKAENALRKRWGSRISKDWYGFNLGIPIPLVWYIVIDKFLEYIEQKCPEFEIYQIKLKFGGLRMYLGKISKEIQQEIDNLENVLTDKYLIY